MVYVLIIAISVSFGVLLHAMAKRRGGNPVLWGSLGASLWFLPIPFLLMMRCRASKDPGSSAS